MFGEEIQRVTARKDHYHEVEEFICNDCRFDKKELEDWTIEGPRKFEKESVINANNYTREIKSVEIRTEKNILMGRDMDRKKLSMNEIDYNETIEGKKIEE